MPAYLQEQGPGSGSLPSLAPSPARWRAGLRLFLVLLFWLGVWQLLAMLIAKPLIMPSPWQAVQAARGLLFTGDFWLTVAVSLWRITAGFVCGVAVGSLLAWLTSVSRLGRSLLAPLIRGVRATPVASFIILALFWFSNHRLPIFIAFLMVVPVVWDNLVRGAAHVDRRLLEMAQVYGFRRGMVLRYIYLPSVWPYFQAACTNSFGLAWKSGIAAEVIASPRWAIGAELNAAKVYLQTPQVFVWTLVVICLSLLLEKGFLRLTRRMDRKIPGKEVR